MIPHSLTRLLLVLSCIGLSRRPLASVILAAVVSISTATAHANTIDAAIVRHDTSYKIDGDPSDWSELRALHAIKTPSGEQVGTFKMAATSEALHLLFEVIDDSPLKNGSSTHQELFKSGDAVGILIGSDVEKIPYQRILASKIDGENVIIALRPEWPRKRMHTFSSPVGTRRMDYVGPISGAEVAFKETADGYIAELAIPLHELGLKANFKGPLEFDAQIIFSDPSGKINIGTAFWHARGGPGFTVEDLPTEAGLYPETWGKARVFQKDPGSRIAQLAAVEQIGFPIQFVLPKKAKVSLVVTDQKGWIVRELLRAETYPEGTHTVTWNGRDRYNEPLPPGDYKWKLAYFDGMGTKFHGSVGNSARPPFRTSDGMGSMGGQHGGARLLASDESGIYIVNGAEEGHPAMRKIDREGYTLWKRSMGGFGYGKGIASDDNSAYLIQKKRHDELFLVRLDPLTGQSIDFANGKKKITFGLDEEPIGGMAVVDQRIYFSRPTLDRIEVIQLPEGTQMAHIAAKQPGDLAPSRDGQLLFLSGNSLRAYDPSSGKFSTQLNSLEAPLSVATAPDGRIFIGEHSQAGQIKIFKAGKMIGTIGKPGGRPATTLNYDSDALAPVKSLTVDKAGSLWAIEQSSLSRVARFSMEGHCELELFGPVAYNAFGPDLDRPSTIYYQAEPKNAEATYVKADVDYERYRMDPVRGGTDAWSIESIFDLGQQPNEQDINLFTESMSMGYGHVVAFKADNGHRYLWRIAKKNRATYPHGALIYRWEHTWIPAAFVSNKKEMESWSDRNGDGLVQSNERYPRPETQDFAWLNRGLKLYGYDGTLAPTRIDERGVPDYEGAEVVPYITSGAKPDELTISGRGWIFNSMPDDEGAVYYAVNSGPHRHRTFWDRASENAIIKVGDNRAQWVIGQNNPYMTNDSDMSTLSGIAGVVDDILIAHLVEPARYLAFTTDGLSLGNVIVNEDGKQPSVGSNAIYIESFTGLFIRDPRNGKRLLFSVSSGDDRILEVTGPGELTRIEGQLTLQSSWPRNREPVGATSIPYETWYGSTSRGYAIDATGHQWTDEAYGLSISDESDVIVGDIRLRRDAGSLFVLASTLSPLDGELEQPATLSQPWGEWMGVELMLGSAQEPSSRLDTQGDTRIFLTVDNKGQGIALSYHNESNQWEKIPRAQVAWRQRIHNYGWRLEAELPLEHFPEITTVRTQSFKRGNPIKERKEALPDITGPIRINAAIHIKTNNEIERIPWLKDGSDLSTPSKLSPEKWGYANALVTLTWPHILEADRFAIYRSSLEDPSQVTLLNDSTVGNIFVDTPGLGSFLYWVAPVIDGVIGQPMGPAQNYLSHAKIPHRQPLTPPTLAGASQVSVQLPHRIALINFTSPAETFSVKSFESVVVRTERFNPDTWTMSVIIPEAARLGDQIPLQLSGSDASGTPVLGNTQLQIGVNLMADLYPGAFQGKQQPHTKWSREPATNASENPKHLVDVIESEQVPGPVIAMSAWNSNNVIRYPLDLRIDTLKRWTARGQIRMLASGGNTNSGVRVRDREGNIIAEMEFRKANIDEQKISVLTAQGDYLINDPDDYRQIVHQQWQPFSIKANQGQIEITFGNNSQLQQVIAAPMNESMWSQPASFEIYQEGRTSGRHLNVAQLAFEVE